MSVLYIYSDIVEIEVIYGVCSHHAGRPARVGKENYTGRGAYRRNLLGAGMHCGHVFAGKALRSEDYAGVGSDIVRLAAVQL